jgi:hypothetical protein
VPSVSRAQKGMMGADLARLRAGEPTVTGMDESQLVDFAKGPGKGLPEHKKPKHHKKHRGGPGMVGAGRQPKPRGGSFY